MASVATVYVMERFSQLGYYITMSLAAFSAVVIGYVYPGMGAREVLLFGILLTIGVLFDTRARIANLARSRSALGLLVGLAITVGLTLALYVTGRTDIAMPTETTSTKFSATVPLSSGLIAM